MQSRTKYMVVHVDFHFNTTAGPLHHIPQCTPQLTSVTALQLQVHPKHQFTHLAREAACAPLCTASSAPPPAI
jgi:hypothetical protein